MSLATILEGVCFSKPIIVDIQVMGEKCSNPRNKHGPVLFMVKISLPSGLEKQFTNIYNQLPLSDDKMPDFLS